MKTSLLVGIVIAVHVVAVGSVALIQGCGTTRPVGVPVSSEPKMPPSVDTARPQLVRPPTADKPVTQAWPAETTTYVVKSGDCLSVIAKRFNVSTKELMALNGLANENMVRAGQKLKLPGKVDLDAPTPVMRKKPVVPEGAAVYEVQRGDCLSVIAQKCGSNIAAVREANGLTSDMVMVGQKLVIPGGTIPAAPKTVAVPSVAPVAPPPVSSMAPAAPVMSPREMPVASAGSVQTRPHTVEEGEDLNTVAMMYAVNITDLQRLNNIDGTELTPGQILKIPTPE